MALTAALAFFPVGVFLFVIETVLWLTESTIPFLSVFEPSFAFLSPQPLSPPLGVLTVGPRFFRTQRRFSSFARRLTLETFPRLTAGGEIFPP